MKINKTNRAQTFGKTPVLTCRIKDSSTKQPHNATLYKMDPLNRDDLSEVKYSKNTQSIKYDFIKANITRNNYKDFYVMKNDTTGEVISCAQTEHRFRRFDKKNPGLSTLIEEAGENPNYINGFEPLLAGIVKIATERFDSTIYTTFGIDKIPDLKRVKFTETKTGVYYMPEKRFDTLLTQAEKHSQIDYIG